MSTPEINGKAVHAFALEMTNLGFQKMADKLVGMLDSDAWRAFDDGHGYHEFLPGEFDYFLSQQGVPREQVMDIKDIEVKARLDGSMDERRSGDVDYRRPLDVVRQEVPEHPSRPIQPFGQKANAGKGIAHRPALGDRTRRYARGLPTRKDQQWAARWVGDRSELAQAITGKLSRDPDLERGVYKLLHARDSARRYEQKPRSDP